MFYPGEQGAFPVVVLDLDDVIHDEPGPDVKIPGQYKTIVIDYNE